MTNENADAKGLDGQGPIAASAVSESLREAPPSTSRAEAIASALAKVRFDHDPSCFMAKEDRFALTWPTIRIIRDALLGLPPLLDGGCSASRDLSPDADAATPKSAATEQVTS